MVQTPVLCSKDRQPTRLRRDLIIPVYSWYNTTWKMKNNSRKMKPVTLVILVLLCAALSNLYAVNEYIKFQHIGSSRGFPQGNVRVIYRDSTGFMWFGTKNGLNKFDGYNFSIYKYKPNDATTPGHRVIRCIYEDLDGTLWTGTENSLDKFDRGRETFAHYRTPIKNLGASNYTPVYSIIESAAAPGTLWLGTMNGLMKFAKDKGSFTVDPVFAKYPTGQPMNTVGQIIEYPQGTLWFASYSGLYKYDLEKEKITNFKHIPSHPDSLTCNSIYSLHKSSQPGILWVGTWEGLDKFDTRTGTFTHYKHDPGDPTSLGYDVVWSICESPVEKGTLWVGFFGGGLDKFDVRSGTAQHYRNDLNDMHSLTGNVVRSVYQDPSGVLWVGTDLGGLNKADRANKRFIHYYQKSNITEGLSDNQVYSIIEAQEQPGISWIGTGNGLNRFDRGSGEFTVFRQEADNPNSLNSSDVRQVYECPSQPGILWIGTLDKGIGKLHIKKNKFVHYEPEPGKEDSPPQYEVRDFHESLLHPGVLWIATKFGGVVRFDTKSETFSTYLFDPADSQIRFTNAIFDIYEAPSRPGILWLASYGSGLIRFDPKAGKFSRFLRSAGAVNSLYSNKIFSIHESPADPGILWLCTGKGLVKFNRESGSPTAFHGLESLLGYIVKRILEDGQGNFWLSTDNGLLKFNPRTGELKKYDVRDGLQGNEFSHAAFKSRAGEMFFGGFEGFNVFSPEQIQDNPYIPPVVITGLKVFNKPVKVGEPVKSGRVVLRRSITETKKIRLSYIDRVFTFEFAALNYTLSERNRYRYKMEGFDEEWVECGTRNSATYTGIPPDSYVFRVKGSNNDGAWNEIGASIRVVITPPWWRTTWAYIFYFIFLAAFIVTLNRLQRARLIRKEQDKAKIREAELRARAAEAQALAVEAENRRKTHELEEARKLQLSMLPEKLPHQVNFDIAVYMKTAQEVGGDYYDFYAAENGALVVAVGDATGHGLKAGTMVSIMKGLFLSCDFSQQADSGVFFNKSTRTIKQMRLENLYMALTLMILKDNKATIASAGMPPVYLIRGKSKKTEVKEIILKAPPLGAFNDFQYPQREVEIRKGDILLLLSDGLPELFDRQEEMFGYSRVKELLKGVGGKSPDQVIDHLVQAGEDWLQGKAQDDDITFVILKAK